VDPALHDDVIPLSFLLGTWRGEGKGSYPTTDAFAYAEEIRFTHTGKAHLRYDQQSWDAASGAPLHSEMGFWRPQGSGRVEIVLAYPLGIVDVEEGTVTGGTIEVASLVTARTSTAKEVARIERTFTVEGDLMRYELRMSAVGVPLVYHADAELRRV